MYALTVLIGCYTKRFLQKTTESLYKTKRPGIDVVDINIQF